MTLLLDRRRLGWILAACIAAGLGVIGVLCASQCMRAGNTSGLRALRDRKPRNWTDCRAVALGVLRRADAKMSVLFSDTGVEVEVCDNRLQIREMVREVVAQSRFVAADEWPADVACFGIYFDDSFRFSVYTDRICFGEDREDKGFFLVESAGAKRARAQLERDVEKLR